MIRIKKFGEFINETALIMQAPNYGYQSLHIPLRRENTEILFSQIKSRFYTYQEYQELYQNYLQAGNKPLEDEFNIKNLEIVVSNID